jgi:hypothetical protein
MKKNDAMIDAEKAWELFKRLNEMKDILLEIYTNDFDEIIRKDRESIMPF